MAFKFGFQSAIRRMHAVGLMFIHGPDRRLGGVLVVVSIAIEVIAIYGEVVKNYSHYCGWAQKKRVDFLPPESWHILLVASKADFKRFLSQQLF